MMIRESPFGFPGNTPGSRTITKRWTRPYSKYEDFGTFYDIWKEITHVGVLSSKGLQMSVYTEERHTMLEYSTGQAARDVGWPAVTPGYCG